MGYALNIQVQLESETCEGCGTVFAVPAHLLRRHREEGAPLRCPNPACPWPSYTRKAPSKVQALTAELEQTRRRLEFERNARAVAEAETAKVTKGMRRLEKRAAGGVCPCCNRTFQSLARHMKTKHPEFAKPAGEKP